MCSINCNHSEYYETLPYIDFDEKKCNRFIFLKSHNPLDNKIMIVVPEKNTVLIEKEYENDGHETIFDVYNMKLSKGENEYIDAYIQQVNSSMDDFKRAMSDWLSFYTYRETIKIKNNKYKIIDKILHDYGIYNINIKSTWTRIFFEKKLNKITIQIVDYPKNEYISYDYINMITPAKETSRFNSYIIK